MRRGKREDEKDGRGGTSLGDGAPRAKLVGEAVL